MDRQMETGLLRLTAQIVENTIEALTLTKYMSPSQREAATREATEIVLLTMHNTVRLLDQEEDKPTAFECHK
ncbi:MAG TPA: hypothetical protein DCP36_08430 [Sporomusaceae bacterium]|jgi:hypothetical protein|uniref:hypothetical protein n=1 Tax=Anaerospora sp. TaxID=1960278 RepID=UPI000EBA5627|nr:hypothetical protein [Anaerospora sp.]HAK73612.1 hypothetical protein [Sporomusaceae bacterium]